MIRPFLATALRLVVLAVLLTPVAGSGKPRATRTPDTLTGPTVVKTSGSARVRIWKACDSKENVDLQIQLLPLGGKTRGVGTSVPVGKDLYQFTSYNDLPAGAGFFELLLPGRAPVPLDVNLTKDYDYTLLVRAQHGTVTGELIKDTLPLGDKGTSLGVYSLLFGDKGDVQVNVGDVLAVHLNTVGGRIRARGLKPDFYPIVVSGKDDKGQPFRWNAETDLRKTPRSALIIYPDAYGRVRPQLIEDGPTSDPNTAAKALVGAGN